MDDTNKQQDVIKEDNKQSVTENLETDIDTDTEVVIKSILKSRTFWVNILAFIALYAQTQYGFVIDETTQMQALAIINIILRAVTKEPVNWKK